MKATVTTPVTWTDQDSHVSSWQSVRQRTTHLEHDVIGDEATPSAVPAWPYCVTISADMPPDAEPKHEVALLLQEGLSLTISEAHAFIAGRASVVVTLDSTGHQLLEALLQSLGLHFEITRM